MSSDTESASLAGTDPAELMSKVVELDPESDPMEIDRGVPYLATVSNIVSYGVFVQLTESWGSDLTGLVHESKLPPFTRPEDYNPGDEIVVELAQRDGDELGFHGHHSPDVDTSRLEADELRETVETLDGDMGAALDELHELAGRVERLEMKMDRILTGLEQATDQHETDGGN